MFTGQNYPPGRESKTILSAGGYVLPVNMTRLLRMIIPCELSAAVPQKNGNLPDFCGAAFFCEKTVYSEFFEQLNASAKLAIPWNMG